MVDYYDGIIVGIFGSVLLGVGASALLGFGVQTGLVAGALVATLFLYDAIIRHPPMPPTDPTMVVPMVGWHLMVGLLGVGLVLD